MPFCFGTFDKLMEEAESYAILFWDIYKLTEEAKS